MLGLVVSPGFIPSRDQLRDLDPPFLRSILYSLDDLDRLKATGYPLLLTVNNEMAEVGWWATWTQAIQAIAERADGQVIGICCGNEFDLFNVRNPADVPPRFAAELVHKAAPILQPKGIKVVACSVAGPTWQTYLEEMATLCGDDADWFDLHPYGQRPDGWGQRPWMHGELRPALIRAVELSGKPVICSEIGVKIGDAGSEEEVAAWLTAAAKTVQQLGAETVPLAAWFAWHDAVGAPSERGQHAFGLLAEDGRQRPAWAAYRAAQDLEVPEPIPEPEPEEPVIMTLDDLRRIRWQALMPNLPYRPEFGIVAAWKDNPHWGSPLTDEVTLDDGRPAQAFSNAIVVWDPEAGAQEVA